MRAHDRTCGRAYLSARKVARRGERAEEQVGRDHQCGDADQPHREVEPAELVVEADGPALPE